MPRFATDSSSDIEPPNPCESTAESSTGLSINPTVETLQTEEQRRVLDTITQVRKCGLESILSLPQIVVCGSQSAGKSSVLEALTGIPFPRNDNLCTRFPTEISLRRGAVEQYVVRVIPDDSRPQDEQQKIKSFSRSITNLESLPVLIAAAMEVMGVASSDSAFAKDTLSIEIEGPNQPQLTLVDIPGLIQASTKGVSETDVAMVAEISDRYISQPRTICLAVVSATNDAANQPILQRVRHFDPDGERTLGVITKPDRLPAGSGSETKFLELARNEDVFFKLGWHVIKNRTFEEQDSSFEKRNASEREFFSTSNFKTLPKETVGIDALRVRLSHLLFEHIKDELPRLRQDLEDALQTAEDELRSLGDSRSTVAECRMYLVQLNMNCHEICKAALNGNYEHDYFKSGEDEPFSSQSKSSIARLRAVIQYVNNGFAEDLRKKGHKYHFVEEGEGDKQVMEPATSEPTKLSKAEGMKWVQEMLLRSRGTELAGNFNPHLIGELFWEQSEAWEKLAGGHIELVSGISKTFLASLLEQKISMDIRDKYWSSLVLNAIERRRQAAVEELGKLMDDKKAFPINYNHYYTDSLHKRRQHKLQNRLEKLMPTGIDHVSYERCSRGDHYSKFNSTVAIDKIISACCGQVTPDMEKFSCEEALDCMLAIYKVQQKTFVANVVTQVIERYILKGLEGIFSPLAIFNMTDAEVEAIASEPLGTRRQRKFLHDRAKKLKDGREIFRGVMGSPFKRS